MKAMCGGCLCAELRYEVIRPPLSQGICFCDHCRKSGGALGSPLLVLNSDDFKLISGESSCFTTRSARGSDVGRHFCKTCGSPVFSRLSDFSNVLTLKAATLDDTTFLSPEYLVWVKNPNHASLAWPGVPQFIGNAPLELLLGDLSDPGHFSTGLKIAIKHVGLFKYKHSQKRT